jgi:UDP-N-acetyl-D-mannosaminuronic acid dehydrogenase
VRRPADQAGAFGGAFTLAQAELADSVAAADFSRDVAVLGGCGHAGLPLAIALASRGASVVSYDVSASAVAAVRAGTAPFEEPGADSMLSEVLADGRLTATADAAAIAVAEHVIVVVDGFVQSRMAGLADYLRPGQLLVLRSTVQPGVTARLEKLTADMGLDVDVAFCPERIAEGQAMTELFELPQIVSSRTGRGLERAIRLFRLISPVLVPMSPEEAELAKLFANAWRYVSFATANQLYAIANDRGLDYERIRQGLRLGYARGADLPRAGFAAGPCLRKDTSWLASAHDGFSIGRAAIAANEGLADYVVSRLEQQYPLADMCVGILGMAFKAGSDHIRESLSYRLKRLLCDRAAAVLCTDPLVTADPELLPIEDVLARADLLVVGTPHTCYRNLAADQPVADIWGVTGRGVLT